MTFELDLSSINDDSLLCFQVEAEEQPIIEQIRLHAYRVENTLWEVCSLRSNKTGLSIWCLQAATCIPNQVSKKYWMTSPCLLSYRWRQMLTCWINFDLPKQCLIISPMRLNQKKEVGHTTATVNTEICFSLHVKRSTLTLIHRCWLEEIYHQTRRETLQNMRSFRLSKASSVSLQKYICALQT